MCLQFERKKRKKGAGRFRSVHNRHGIFDVPKPGNLNSLLFNVDFSNYSIYFILSFQASFPDMSTSMAMSAMAHHHHHHHHGGGGGGGVGGPGAPSTGNSAAAAAAAAATASLGPNEGGFYGDLASVAAASGPNAPMYNSR